MNAPSTPNEPAGKLDALLAQHGPTRRIVLAVPHFLVAPDVVEASDLAWVAPARLLDA